MISQLRNEISTLDQKIAELLCERLQLVEQIQKEKAKHGQPVEDLTREAEVLASVKQNAPEKFHSSLEAIYQSIFLAGKKKTAGKD